jgi:hypothetical protein
MRTLLVVALLSGCIDASSPIATPDASTSDALVIDAAPQLGGCSADLPGLVCNAHGLCVWEGGQCCALPAPCVAPDERCLTWR